MKNVHFCVVIVCSNVVLDLSFEDIYIYEFHILKILHYIIGIHLRSFNVDLNYYNTLFHVYC